MQSRLLTKYWITFSEASGYPLGVGVTAYNPADAEHLLVRSLFKNGPLPAFEQRVINSLDELEQNHVLPNIGLIAFRGIWYPKLGTEPR